MSLTRGDAMTQLRMALLGVLLVISPLPVLGADKSGPKEAETEKPSSDKQPHSVLLSKSQAITYTPSQLPWEKLPAAIRDRARQVVEQAKLSSPGTPEEFSARPDL